VNALSLPLHRIMRALRFGGLQALIVAIVCSTSVAALGCRSDSSEDAPAPEPGSLDAIAAAQRDVKSPLVSGREVRVAGDTPAGVLLRWWRLIQFSAPVSEISRFYSSSARPAPTMLSRQLAAIRYYFLDRKPYISDQQTQTSTARVFALLARDPRGRDQADPTVFSFKRANGQWRFADNEFAAGRYQLEQRFTEEQVPPEELIAPEEQIIP
jgi:hypothetical protein